MYQSIKEIRKGKSNPSMENRYKEPTEEEIDEVKQESK
jgi:hypothetical protein